MTSWSPSGIIACRSASSWHAATALSSSPNEPRKWEPNSPASSRNTTYTSPGSMAARSHSAANVPVSFLLFMVGFLPVGVLHADLGAGLGGEGPLAGARRVPVIATRRAVRGNALHGLIDE